MKRGPAAMVGVWHKWHSTGSRAASSSPFSPSSSSSLLSLFSYFSLSPFPPPIPGSSVLPTVPPFVAPFSTRYCFLIAFIPTFLRFLLLSLIPHSFYIYILSAYTHPSLPSSGHAARETPRRRTYGAAAPLRLLLLRLVDTPPVLRLHGALPQPLWAGNA
ncbi:hypothetical protein C8J57DRAFT_1713492 [Mycena rebaudengoi]|nr:hypothetical protein C8J57DRAFT_1713492 [Mycena rebaudengoi]